MSMSIIVVLELGPIACESNVNITFSTCNIFLLLILGLKLNPMWQTHHFQKKRPNLKFANYLGVPWIQQILVTMKLTSNNNCSNSFYKQCEGKNLMKLTFNIWGHPWQDLCHEGRTKESPIFTKYIIEN